MDLTAWAWEFVEMLTIWAGAFFAMGMFLNTSKEHRRNHLPFLIPIYVCLSLGFILSFALLITIYNDVMSFFSCFIVYFALFLLSFGGVVMFFKATVTRFLFAFYSGVLTVLIGSRFSNYICNITKIGKAWSFTVSTLTMSLVIVLIYFTLAKKIRHDDNFNPELKTLLILGISASFVMPIAYLESYVQNNQLGYFFLILAQETVYVVFLYFHFMMYGAYKEKTRATIEEALMEERLKQTKDNQEIINSLNIKIHDLKHQIKHIGSDSEISQAFADDLYKSIGEYDSIVKTGNDLLDAILSEKSLRCERDGIDFTVMIDGKLLAFMSPVDLNSLFGNIIDNAIEAENKISEKEKRFISMTTRLKDNFLTVIVENKTESSISFDKNHMPISDKGDSLLHGFGTHSIAQIAKKYQGQVTFEANDGIFSLVLLFPKSLS